MTIYDLSGKKKKVKGIGGKYRGVIQCIVDDKIYYLTLPYKPYEKPINVTIMRCNLDGSNKEKLFQYQFTLEYQYWINTENLRIDGDYIYLMGEYSGTYGLARIPLYGGKIEGVTENVGYYFDLSDDGIFILNFNKDICKVDKALSATPTAVTKVYYYEYGLHSMESYPFHCANGHLMVQAGNKKKRTIANKALDYAGFMGKWDLCIDVGTGFAPDYYWITEDGEVEDTIKGSGVKKKWKKIAATWKYDD